MIWDEFKCNQLDKSRVDNSSHAVFAGDLASVHVHSAAADAGAKTCCVGDSIGFGMCSWAFKKAFARFVTLSMARTRLNNLRHCIFLT
jgi:hypothetical protein